MCCAQKLKVESTEEEEEQPVVEVKTEVKTELKTEMKMETGGNGPRPNATEDNGDTAAPSVKHEDDDALTNMSLSEDLEIFDGLKFEDGDVIDLNQHVSMATNADEDDGDTDEQADGDAGQDAEVDDEIGDDDMYDDDNEENDDGSGNNHSEDDQEQLESADSNGDVDAGDVGGGQVPEEPVVPLEDNSALL
jgi:hypothetical protein